MEYFAITNWDIGRTQVAHIPSWVSGYDVEVL